MHALRKLHTTLVPGGAIVDTQPVAARPVVSAAGVRLGALDGREWTAIVREIDDRVDETFAAGLFELRTEERLLVTEGFDEVEEALDEMSGWAGTRVPRRLAARIAAAEPPVIVEQKVRLRLLRRA